MTMKVKVFRLDQFDLEALSKAKKKFGSRSENQTIQHLLRWFTEVTQDNKNTVFSVSEERVEYAAHPEEDKNTDKKQTGG